MTILDTSILVALLKDDEAVKERIRALEAERASLSTTAITAYELLKGAEISLKKEENVTKVRALVSSLNVIGLGINACEEAAKIYHELRAKGKIIGEFDVLIASIVKSVDDELVTRDEHFKYIRGLRVSKW